MYKMKLGIALFDGIEIPVTEQIRMARRIGFEAFATMYAPDEELAEYKAAADECGMAYQYIHAPYFNAAKMWTADAEEYVAELIACADSCAKIGIPIMVMHAFIGFENGVEPSKINRDIGIQNYRRVVAHARELGVKVAIENTEGEEYLAILMSSFAELDNVGFCLDTGHELCYNFGKDMTALYGDRLLVTHINDNLGVRDFSGEITWHDDLHLLPFDGIYDFENLAERLARSAPLDTLMLEIVKKNKPDRLCNSKYERLELEEYMTEAYARACRIGALVLKAKNR